MKPTLISLQSSERTTRANSLPNKIKIRTCKLPKDFFQNLRGSSESMKTSRISRKSTCDDDLQAPSTPSFRMSNNESIKQIRSSRKNETTKVRLHHQFDEILPFRERTQNLRRRVNDELKGRFPVF